MKSIFFRAGIAALTIGWITAATSCHQGNNTSSNEAASLEAQLSTIHDETMGKIAPVRRVEDSLREKIKAFAEEKKDTSALSEAAAALNTSDTAMFGWMGRYQDLATSADSANVDLLKQHLESLKQIDATMDSTIEQGRKLLQ